MWNCLLSFLKIIISLVEKEISTHSLDKEPSSMEKIQVYLGKDGTLEKEILSFFIEKVVGVEIVSFPHCSLNPIMWLESEEDDGGTIGCFSICRYISRKRHLHPRSAEDAIHVDASLELLQNLCLYSEVLEKSDFQEKLNASLSILHTQAGTEEWLHDMDGMTVSDICWHSSIRFFLQKEFLTLSEMEEKHPLLLVWYENMEGVNGDKKMD